MSLYEILTTANLGYVANPCNFLSLLKSDFVLVFDEVLSIEETDHFVLGTKLETKRSKRVCIAISIKSLKADGKPVHVDDARRVLRNLIDAGIKETIIIYVVDHNGRNLYLGVEDGKPFRIFNDVSDVSEVVTDKNSMNYFACSFELLSGLKDVPSTSISLGLDWKSPKFEMFQKPGVDAQPILYVNFVNGEIDTETHDQTQNLWKALHNLERFEAAYRNNGDFINVDSIICKSNQILSFLSDYGKNEPLDSQDDILLKKRQDYDFTDYLWDFMQDINSKDDLVQVMTAIVEALESQTLLPYISSANKTAFASALSKHVSLSLKNICKKSDQDALFNVYDSWIQDPLPVVFELGIRKCFMDISYNFNGFLFLC